MYFFDLTGNECRGLAIFGDSFAIFGDGFAIFGGSKLSRKI